MSGVVPFADPSAERGRKHSSSREVMGQRAASRSPIRLGHEAVEVVTGSPDPAPVSAPLPGLPGAQSTRRSPTSWRGLNRWAKGFDLIGVLPLPVASTGQKLP